MSLAAEGCRNQDAALFAEAVAVHHGELVGCRARVARSLLEPRRSSPLNVVVLRDEAFDRAAASQLRETPTLTHRLCLWGCVGEVVGSPRADTCVLTVCDDRGATAFGVRPRE